MKSVSNWKLFRKTVFDFQNDLFVNKSEKVSTVCPVAKGRRNEAVNRGVLVL